MKKKKCFVIILDMVRKNNARQSVWRAAFNLIKLEVKTWLKVMERYILTQK